MNNRVLIISGPTASGKSSYAKEVALKENGVIINCDAMQVYDVLNELTARPTAEDEEQIEHRLYGFLDPEVACNAFLWREKALHEIDDVLSKGKLPILVGGTGMYIKSLMEGLSPIPEIPEEIRNEARRRLEEEGSEVLHKEISKDDQERLNVNDSQRVCRAYEVYKATGHSMGYWNSKENIGIRKDLDFELIILMPDNEQLKVKSDARFEKMIERGAISEVKVLMERNIDSNLPVMKSIGVPEIMAYLRHEISLEEAITSAKRQTMRYAKRQKTFLKKLKANYENRKK